MRAHGAARATTRWRPTTSFNFVVSPAEPVRVVAGRSRAAPHGEPLPVARAGDRRGAALRGVTRQPDALSDEDLRTQRRWSCSTTCRCRRRWRGGWRASSSGGGGLLVAAGRARAWPSDVDVLPASLGAPGRSHARATRRASAALEYGHPVFELFRAPRSGDFSSARFYGYRQRHGRRQDAQVLARFDDGAPALRRAARGQRAACCCGPRRSTTTWNDLPLKPVFLPFVHRVDDATWRAYVQPQPWLTVGTGARSRRRRAPRKGQAPPRVLLTPVGRASTARRRGRRGARADRAGLLRAARRRATRPTRSWWPATSIRPSRT